MRTHGRRKRSYTLGDGSLILGPTLHFLDFKDLGLRIMESEEIYHAYGVYPFL